MVWGDFTFHVGGREEGGGLNLSNFSSLSTQVQKLTKRRPYLVLQCFWEFAKVIAEEFVVPGEQLIDHHIGVLLELTGTGGKSNAERICLR